MMTDQDPFRNLTCFPTLAYECRAHMIVGQYRYVGVVWLNSVSKPLMFHWELHRNVKTFVRLAEGKAQHCRLAQQAVADALQGELAARKKTAQSKAELVWKCY